MRSFMWASLRQSSCHLLLLAALCRCDIDCDMIMTCIHPVAFNSGTRRRTSQGGWLAMMLENLVALLAARAQGD